MMRSLAVLVAVLSSLCFAGCVAPDGPPPESPYAEHLGNDVRGLSAAEIEALRTGAGMGFALAAEVNGWPGPLHALELAAELDLTAEQVATLQALRQEMLDAAIPLGEAIIAAHQRLEEGFRSGEMDAERLGEDVAALEGLYARLRVVHLETHLEAYPVFTEHQRMEYARLRGYTEADDGHADHDAHSH